MGCISPLLAVRNMKETIEFYKNSLGFRVGMCFPDANNPEYADLSKDGMVLMVIPAENHGISREEKFGIGVNLYMQIDGDIDDYYEELKNPVGIPPKLAQSIPKQRKAAFQLLVDSIVALVRENKEILWSSMVKETMKRKRPSFSESSVGYRTFSELLDDAARHGLIRIRQDEKSGSYIVIGFGKEEGK